MDLVKQQSAERRARVLETARRLIAERGYDGVSMRELARESRCSVPTLYKLFGDKSALLVAAVESHFSGLLTSAAADGAGSGRERLLAIFEGCGRELVRIPGYSREVLAVVAGRTDELRDMVAQATIAEIELALKRMRDEGELETWVDPRALAERLGSHLMMVTLEWLAGQIGPEQVSAVMVYGACMMVLGAARGGAADEIEARARALQETAVVGRAAAKPSSGGAGSTTG